MSLSNFQSYCLTKVQTESTEIVTGTPLREYSINIHDQHINGILT